MFTISYTRYHDLRTEHVSIMTYLPDAKFINLQPHYLFKYTLNFQFTPDCKQSKDNLRRRYLESKFCKYSYHRSASEVILMESKRLSFYVSEEYTMNGYIL